MNLAPIVAVLLATGPLALADGIVRPPVAYKGSLEERAQEAIIVFRGGTESRSAVEDLILKIRVEGEASDFAWVVPFPNAPKTAKADARLFRELHDYVEHRKSGAGRAKGDAKAGAQNSLSHERPGVEVVSREVVGNFDVAVVREREGGGLQKWLKDEGFQALPGGDALIESYRRKNYVFACIKVSEVARAEGVGQADLHPLRFTFETGGRDGIYFPMRITGLQKAPFDVNLHVFYRAWLNDDINRFGFTGFGFRLVHRDWDTARCTPNAGKTWSDPRGDPYLRELAHLIPTLTRFFDDHFPGKRFYLTNLQARNMDPEGIRAWTNDLWMFPHYTDPSFVPHDKREGGAAVD